MPIRIRAAPKRHSLTATMRPCRKLYMAQTLTQSRRNCHTQAKQQNQRSNIKSQNCGISACRDGFLDRCDSSHRTGEERSLLKPENLRWTCVRSLHRDTKSFLFDFEVFPGNSGGPVYFVDKSRTYGGTTHMGQTVQFVAGLVARQHEKLRLAVVVPAHFTKQTLTLLDEK